MESDTNTELLNPDDVGQSPGSCGSPYHIVGSPGGGIVRVMVTKDKLVMFGLIRSTVFSTILTEAHYIF